MSTFFELYMQDKATIDDLDVFLEKWHNENDSRTINEFLGLTEKQYYSWCENPSKLKQELDAIKNGQGNSTNGK